MKTTKRHSKICQSVAYHEAGHAVACWLLGVRIDEVSIEPDGDCDGFTRHEKLIDGLVKRNRRSSRSCRRLQTYATIACAGFQVQRRFNPKGTRFSHAREDVGAIRTAVGLLADSEEEFTIHVRLLETFTEELIKLPGSWARIEALSRALLKHRTLSGGQGSRGLRKGWPSHWTCSKRPEAVAAVR